MTEQNQQGSCSCSCPNKDKKAVESTRSTCPDCGTELKSGLKYENICTTCNPEYSKWCGGCQRRLWDCMCIKPHTWE